MKKTTKLFFLTIVLLGSFYYFVAYNRKYNWSKEFEEEVYKATMNCSLKFLNIQECDAHNINLPAMRTIQINCQKALSSVGLMHYSKEFGTQINFLDTLQENNVSIFGFCSGDHLLGIEIKCSEKSKQLNKNNIEKQFDNYEIIWTTN